MFESLNLKLFHFTFKIEATNKIIATPTMKIQIPAVTGYSS